MYQCMRSMLLLSLNKILFYFDILQISYIQHTHLTLFFSILIIAPNLSHDICISLHYLQSLQKCDLLCKSLSLLESRLFFLFSTNLKKTIFGFLRQTGKTQRCFPVRLFSFFSRKRKGLYATCLTAEPKLMWLGRLVTAG